MKRTFSFWGIDFVMLGTLLLLSGIGILAIRSATVSTSAYSANPYRQTYWLAVALAAFFVGFFLDRRALRRGAYPFYFAVLVILAGLSAAGMVSGQVHRWLHLGGISFQPSEIGKVALILALARYFNNRKKPPPYGLEDIAIPILMVAAYVVPVAIQPDLGTALFMVILAIPVFLMVGIKLWTAVFIVGTAAASTPFFFLSIKDYQKERILSFLDPGRDPLGTGYHVVQSKIAIGSGGLLGKGLFHGTQSQLRFIPEQHTDFIFSVIGEEFGFVGVVVVLAIMLFLTLWLLSYFDQEKSKFALLTVVGISCAFALQTVINISMTVGILPVVGLPLPLLSYGGSSLVSTFFGCGVIAGFRRRRG